jgi:hypothetical protein
LHRPYLNFSLLAVLSLFIDLAAPPVSACITPLSKEAYLTAVAMESHGIAEVLRLLLNTLRPLLPD